MQARTAGLTWRPEWAGGRGFLQARAALSKDVRAKALRRYLAAPPDGASANGVTLGLALLAQGRLLGPKSTVHLLTLMRSSRTGPLRLKSGLRPGWTLAHKTGTQHERACNVGIAYFAPERPVVVAVCTEKFSSRKKAEGTIADVARALTGFIRPSSSKR